MADVKLHRDNGVVIGVVKSLEDPLGIGRVVVEYPCLENKDSAYARLVLPMAGPQRGSFFRPEVGDEVLVVFEHGEPRRPYVLGSVWSKADPPPLEQGKKQDNHLRVIVSRSGHVLKFDDTPGGEKIEIIDKDGQRKVILDSPGKKIRVICDQGDVEVAAKAGKVKVEALQVELKASGSMKLEAGGTLSIKGATVNIN